jgi:hypothetical protein
MPTRHIRKMYPAVPFDIAESDLARELQAYYQAIYSYPDRYAKTRMSFQRHLLHVILAFHGQSRADAEHLKSVS